MTNAPFYDPARGAWYYPVLGCWVRKPPPTSLMRPAVETSQNSGGLNRAQRRKLRKIKG